MDTKQVRFALLGDRSLTSRRLSGETYSHTGAAVATRAARQPIADWVRARGRPVGPTLWRPDAPPSRRLATRLDGMQLYDLGPAAGIRPAASR